MGDDTKDGSCLMPLREMMAKKIWSSGCLLSQTLIQFCESHQDALILCWLPISWVTCGFF